MKFPKLSAQDEHLFYVLEGAMLHLFGKASLDAFMEVSADFRLHSLAYTCVNSFTCSTLEESDQHPESDDDKKSVMRQLSCVRRCVFAPLLRTLKDCYTDETIGFAIEESVEDAESYPYREAIHTTIAEVFMALGDDDEFANFLRASEEVLELERQNLAKLLSHTELFAEKQRIDMVLSDVSTGKEIDDYLVSQFEPSMTRVEEYLSWRLEDEDGDAT